ncbi:hypothetical protein [Neorhodopirellula lusitana]|uniref:hypothetical protein n=1 Tax=Neorhodopirellula lusitana TaxID=445327 RepID=UPI00384FF9D4
MTHEEFDASDSDPEGGIPDTETASVSTHARFDPADLTSSEASVADSDGEVSSASEVYDDIGDDDEIPAPVNRVEASADPMEAVDDVEIDAAGEISSVDSQSDEVAEGGFQPAGSDEELLELQQPFVGRWNTLISTTNWEKGRIISQWREALIEAGAPATEYSDEAWASRVGGVTSPHVGRLRRVHDRFADQAKTYEALYWSHFLAALDWDDAALWLQGAVEEKWSVSQMREQRWKTNGEVESDRPNGSQIVEVDLDEDTPDLGTAPEQAGKTGDYDGDTDGIASGPAYEAPDFGDESELATMPEGNNMNDANGGEEGGIATDTKVSPTQPFAGLPELPDDMADAIESLKLSILRHKSAGFEDLKPETIRLYLEAVAMLIEQ